MQFAKRIGQIPPYPFVQISRKIAEKRAEGIEVISFGIGDPDLPTPDAVLEALRDAALDAPNHRYPESEGLPEFRQGVAEWYERRFGVVLDPEKQVLSTIGAKEAIGHVALCFLNAGDVALVPDPGYPVYGIGTLFAGGESHILPLTEENRWLPDLDAIPEDIAAKAKVLWLNYPNNPTGAIAEPGYFDSVVAFAKRHEVAVMHDACYSEIAYGGYRPSSFLQADGAMDVGLEFHSLSKTYNMTGWRLGMVVGNPEMIDSLLVVKSNLDSGVPQAIQRMGVAALNVSTDWLDERNSVYERRRDRVVDILRTMGLTVATPSASLYVWAKVPDGYTSAEFAEKLLEERDVLVSTGGQYGQYGEGYVRLSLTIADDALDKAIDRIATWNVPAPEVATS